MPEQIEQIAKRYVVIARTYRQVQDWRLRHNISPKRVCAITGAHDLRCLFGTDLSDPSKIEVVWTGDPHDYADIIDRLAICRWVADQVNPQDLDD